MLGEALSMLDRAQRLQRQFFTHDVVSWEPPVDIVEADNALLVHVALPGVSADAITVALDPAGITISALRAPSASRIARSSPASRKKPPQPEHSSTSTFRIF